MKKTRLVTAARSKITETKYNISKFTDRELGSNLVVDITIDKESSLLVLLTVNEDLTANCLMLIPDHDLDKEIYNFTATQVKRDLSILKPLSDFLGEDSGLIGAVNNDYL